MEKICTRCKIPKNISEFNKRKQAKDGLNSWCRLCVKIDNETRKGKYTEKNKQYRKKYEQQPHVQARLKKKYLDNIEQIRERTLKYYWSLKGQITHYLKSAKKRNLEFSLTDDDCILFFNKTCFYCGDIYKGLGIDRIENDKGYIYSNCTPCCSNCNFMKRNLSLQDFKFQIEKIYKKICLQK